LSNIIAIAAAADSNDGSLALRANGTVVGFNGLSSNPLPGVSNLVGISVGGEHVMALESDGTVDAPSFTFPLVPAHVMAMNASYYFGGIVLLNDGSPVFTVQPGNQFPTNGGTIWLHARAVGVQPMTYQWQFDGTNIAGATNGDLTITNARVIDSGQYCALASNQVGSAASRVGSVTIALVHIPTQLGIPTLLPNGSLLFDVYATNGSVLELNNSSSVLFEASSNLIDWIPLTNAATLTNGSVQLSDPSASNSPARFYRLLRE
jgi:hypothetical protein